jgi:hypothetical protein
MVFLITQEFCNPFLTGIWGIINAEIPVKSIVSGDKIVKTLVLFEFEIIDRIGMVFYNTRTKFPKKFYPIKRYPL